MQVFTIVKGQTTVTAEGIEKWTERNCFSSFGFDVTPFPTPISLDNKSLWSQRMLTPAPGVRKDAAYDQQFPGRILGKKLDDL